MAKYNLQPNEVVLLKHDNVMLGERISWSRHEMILTNLNIVLVKRDGSASPRALVRTRSTRSRSITRRRRSASARVAAAGRCSRCTS